MAVYSQGLIHRLLTGFVRLAGGLRPFESPWDRVALRVPVAAFGPGSRRHFAHYFEGKSGVRIESIDGIVEWLLTCEYVTDSRLFNEPDRWQHPSSFEELRRGDCEDFALWTWRKLAELEIDAEFYVGRVLLNDEPHVLRQHAWVVFCVDDVEYLFEPAAREESPRWPVARGAQTTHRRRPEAFSGRQWRQGSRRPRDGTALR